MVKVTTKNARRGMTVLPSPHFKNEPRQYEGSSWGVITEIGGNAVRVAWLDRDGRRVGNNVYTLYQDNDCTNGDLVSYFNTTPEPDPKTENEIVLTNDVLQAWNSAIERAIDICVDTVNDHVNSDKLIDTLGGLLKDKPVKTK